MDDITIGADQRFEQRRTGAQRLSQHSLVSKFRQTAESVTTDKVAALEEVRHIKHTDRSYSTYDGFIQLIVF